MVCSALVPGTVLAPTVREQILTAPEATVPGTPVGRISKIGKSLAQGAKARETSLVDQAPATLEV